MYNSISMTQAAATFAEVLQIGRPAQAQKPIDLVKELRERYIKGAADRLLIYNPDAIGMWLFQKYTSEFAPVLRHTQLGLPMRTVMPSVTPVCFGTMYTGVDPAVHGIQKYEKS